MTEVKEQSSLQCVQCNKTFRRKRHIEKHLQGHTDNNCKLCDAFLSTSKQHVQHMFQTHNIVVKLEKYQCKHCEKRFLKKIQLYYHYKKLHAGGLVVCFKCGIFLNPVDVKAHQVKHEEESPWKCKTCKPCQFFPRKQQYLAHIKGHEKYRCYDCDLSFPTKDKWRCHYHKVHHHKHWDEKPYDCPICGMKFLRPGLFIQHSRKHSGEKPFGCKDCNKQYTSLKGFKKHLSCTHQHNKAETLDNKPNTSMQKQSVDAKNNSKYYQCDKCDKSFGKKLDLVKHFERPNCELRCKFCSYKSTTKENAKRHIALHTESRQFVCEQCGTAFFTLSNLQDHHQYVHSDERSFKCPQCPSAFKTNSVLKRHRLTHSDLRPYGCHCGQTYKRISHLHRHQNSTHGPIKSKRLQRLQRDESGALVPVVEVKIPRTRNKVKADRRQSDTTNENQIQAPVVSLFVADSGHVYTLQQTCASELPESTAHQNAVGSYQTELLQTMQVAYDQHLPPEVNSDSHMMFSSVETVVERYPHMQLHEPVEPPLMDESFFSSHEPRTMAHYQQNEISLTSDPSFFRSHHGAGSFGVEL